MYDPKFKIGGLYKITQILSGSFFIFNDSFLNDKMGTNGILDKIIENDIMLIISYKIIPNDYDIVLDMQILFKNKIGFLTISRHRFEYDIKLKLIS